MLTMCGMQQKKKKKKVFLRQQVTRHLNSPLCVVSDVFVLRSPPFCLWVVFCAAELVNGLSQ